VTYWVTLLAMYTVKSFGRQMMVFVWVSALCSCWMLWRYRNIRQLYSADTQKNIFISDIREIHSCCRLDIVSHWWHYYTPLPLIRHNSTLPHARLSFHIGSV